MEGIHQDRLIGRYIFKEYRVKKKLGEGSFGKVYIASNIKSNELFAIKLVSKINFYKLTYINFLSLGKKISRK
jgi:serine/threonine protein kinase